MCTWLLLSAGPQSMPNCCATIPMTWVKGTDAGPNASDTTDDDTSRMTSITISQP